MTTDTAARPAPTSTPTPAYLGAVVILLAIIMTACLVTAVSSVVVAVNSSETCRSVADPAWPGDPAPCW